MSHRRPLSAGRGIPDARTPFGMERIPCGNPIRRMPDGVPPEYFDGVFPAAAILIMGLVLPVEGSVEVNGDGFEGFKRRPAGGRR